LFSFFGRLLQLIKKTTALNQLHAMIMKGIVNVCERETIRYSMLKNYESAILHWFPYDMLISKAKNHLFFLYFGRGTHIIVSVLP
jgi:hypothetical protein